MRRSLIVAAAITCTGCSMFASSAPPVEPTARPALGNWGIDLSAMDRSVKPGENFFTYVNGSWFKTAVIPPDRASTGSFLTGPATHRRCRNS